MLVGLGLNLKKRLKMRLTKIKGIPTPGDYPLLVYRPEIKSDLYSGWEPWEGLSNLDTHMLPDCTEIYSLPKREKNA